MKVKKVQGIGEKSGAGPQTQTPFFFFGYRACQYHIRWWKLEILNGMVKKKELKS